MCYDDAREGGKENMKNRDRIRTALKNDIKTQFWNKYEYEHHLRLYFFRKTT